MTGRVSSTIGLKASEVFLGGWLGQSRGENLGPEDYGELGLVERNPSARRGGGGWLFPPVPDVGGPQKGVGVETW
jgi:hypothetical protein